MSRQAGLTFAIFPPRFRPRRIVYLGRVGTTPCRRSDVLPRMEELRLQLMKSIRHLAVAAAAIAAIGVSALPASAQGARVSAGTLNCSVAPGVSFIFGSTRRVNCIYYNADGMAERYVGHIDRFGVDVGYTNAATMMWAVLAGTKAPPPGSLSGKYAGVSAAVTPGVGGAANVLVGGSNRTISLQPISIEGNTGLNLAAGIGALTLHHPRPR
jgi:hypothetical protein